MDEADTYVTYASCCEGGKLETEVRREKTGRGAGGDLVGWPGKGGGSGGTGGMRGVWMIEVKDYFGYDAGQWR
jgi:hypothetical protein